MAKPTITIKPERVHITMHSFILKEINEITAATGMSLTAFIEEASREKLRQWGRDPFSDEAMTKRLAEIRQDYAANNTKSEVQKHLKSARGNIRT